MKGRRTLTATLALIGAVALLAGPVEARGLSRSIPGSYLAQLDLGALGAPRIEALFVVLNWDGSLIFASEHEDDKESASIGVWRRLPGGKIGLGAAGFRFGPDPATSICGAVGVSSPPGNCVLKVGGTVSRQPDGSLAGELFLTVESLDGTTVFSFPGDPPLPISLERLRLDDFPGALP